MQSSKKTSVVKPDCKKFEKKWTKVDDEGRKMGGAERLWKCELDMEPCKDTTYVRDERVKQTEDKGKDSKKSSKDEQFWKEEEPDEYTLYYLDLGESLIKMKSLLKLLDRNFYSTIKTVEDMKNWKSQYTVKLNNLQRLGLKVILNRIAFVINVGDYWTGSMNVPVDKRNINNQLTEFVWRSDSTFAEQLGHLTGCSTVYKSLVLVMMEGPELSILDVLRQLDDWRHWARFPLNGCVLFVMTHVMMRYLFQWVELKVDGPKWEEDYLPFGEDKVEAGLAHLGGLCRRLWCQLRRSESDTTTRKKTTSNLELKVPAEKSLAWACSLKQVRALDPYLTDLLKLTEDDGFKWPEWGWPCPRSPLPTTAHMKEPCGAQPQVNWQGVPITNKLEGFLSEEVASERLAFDAVGRGVPVDDKKIMGHFTPAEFLVDQPSLMQLLQEKDVKT